MKIFIVDDHAPRAIVLAEESIKRGYETIWFRPQPTAIAGDCRNYEKRVKNRSDLEKIVSATGSDNGPVIWLWDMELTFCLDDSGGLEQFDTKDYLWRFDETQSTRIGSEPVLRKLLLPKLNLGNVIVFSTTSQSLAPVLMDWKPQLPEDKRHKVDGIFNWVNQVTLDSKSGWARDTVDLATRLALGRRSLKELWTEEYKGYFAPGDPTIPHSFNNDTWVPFWKLICDWYRLPNTGDSFPYLQAALKKNFKGYFEAAKRLVGDSAWCHVGKNYPPSLSVISLLLLRAAAVTYDDQKLAILAEQVAPTDPLLHDISLSYHESQDIGNTQEWLCILADKVLPILVENHTGGGASSFACKYDSGQRSFEITFQGKWAKLAQQIHSLNCTAGSLSEAVCQLSKALGDCGSAIGRRQRCVFNAWIHATTTHLEVRATK